MRHVAADRYSARALFTAARRHARQDSTRYAWHQYYRLGRYLPGQRLFIVQVATAIIALYKRKKRKRGSAVAVLRVELGGRRQNIPLLK